MRFLVNELSLHKQYPDIESFKASLYQVMRIKNILSDYDHTLHIHRDFYSSMAGQNMAIRDAIKTLPTDQKNAILSWITTRGPFWTDYRQHLDTDVFYCEEEDISGSALAEIAYNHVLNEKASSVSFSPSKWEKNPIQVIFENENIYIDNFWALDAVRAYAISSLPEISSWNMLKSNSTKCFERLSFLDNTFKYLAPVPFSSHIAREIFRLLKVLNDLKGCFDSSGAQTQRWGELYDQFFKGDSPRFSDSSDSEKNSFRSELTFLDPTTNKRTLFCPWHGKIHSPQIRIHFNYPIKSDLPLLIAYIGPKITKK